MTLRLAMDPKETSTLSSYAGVISRRSRARDSRAPSSARPSARVAAIPQSRRVLATLGVPPYPSLILCIVCGIGDSVLIWNPVLLSNCRLSQYVTDTTKREATCRLVFRWHFPYGAHLTNLVPRPAYPAADTFSPTEHTLPPPARRHGTPQTAARARALACGWQQRDACAAAGAHWLCEITK